MARGHKSQEELDRPSETVTAELREVQRLLRFGLRHAGEAVDSQGYCMAAGCPCQGRIDAR